MAPSATEGLSLPAGRQGLILQFDKLSVVSLSKEAVPLISPLKEEFRVAEVSMTAFCSASDQIGLRRDRLS